MSIMSNRFNVLSHTIEQHYERADLWQGFANAAANFAKTHVGRTWAVAADDAQYYYGHALTRDSNKIVITPPDSATKQMKAFDYISRMALSGNLHAMPSLSSPAGLSYNDFPPRNSSERLALFGELLPHEINFRGKVLSGHVRELFRDARFVQAAGFYECQLVYKQKCKDILKELDAVSARINPPRHH